MHNERYPDVLSIPSRSYKENYVDHRDDQSVAARSFISTVPSKALSALERRNQNALELVDSGWMGGLSNVYSQRLPVRRSKKPTQESPNRCIKKPTAFSLIESQLKNKKHDILSTEFTDPGCWGCRNGILTEDSEINELQGCKDIMWLIKNNLFKISLDEFFISVKNIFDVELKVQVAKLTEVDPPQDWSLESIKHHFSHCICDPTIDQRLKINDLQTIYEIAKQNVFRKVSKKRRRIENYGGGEEEEEEEEREEEEDDGEVEIDRESVGVMLQVGNALTSCYLRNNEKSSAFSLGVASNTKKEKPHKGRW